MSDMKYGVKDTSFPQQTRRDKSSKQPLEKNPWLEFYGTNSRVGKLLDVGMEEQHGRQNNRCTTVSSDKEEQRKQYYDHWCALARGPIVENAR